MKTKNHLLLIFILTGISFVATSCKTGKYPDIKTYSKTYSPPGTVKIGENLYFDQAEDRNLDYVEYVFWIYRVYGNTSTEYLKALPDTNVWMNDYKCLNAYIYYYLRHPSYRNYPVVGITKSQAEDYSKWRSDRVFEMLLISFGKLKMNPNQNRDNVFTIENYYSGKYNNMPADTSIHFYPLYSLPGLEEWQKAIAYNDSLMMIGNNTVETLQVGINPCINDTTFRSPTRSVYGENKKFNEKYIYGLSDNVRELISKDSTTLGASWVDKKADPDLINQQGLQSPNAYTGFRNVCRWVEYKKD